MTKMEGVCKGTIFVNSDIGQSSTLTTKVSEEPTDDVNGRLLTLGAEQPQNAGLGANNDEDSSAIMNGFNVPERKFHM
jgi:hypothetical protein